MKAVGYIRVSTREQAEDGVSLDNQRKRIKLFCDAKEWELTGIYSDAGKSGANLKRNGVQELIDDCGSGKFDVVVIYKLDRLTRSVRDLGYLIEEVFDKTDVGFSSVSDNFDTTTPNGRLVLHILASVAQWEREIICERTKETTEYLRSERRKFSPLPLGYEAGEDGRLIENENELAVVKKIKVLRKRGASYQKIADRLNDAGIPTKKNGQWYKATVRNVVNNPLYA
ncbi:recombinase family protein [Candidatus Poribacteria bacterium]